MPAAILTAKRFCIPLANMQAVMTGLAGGLGLNQNHWDSCNCSLVVGEHSQLIERPVVMLSALLRPFDYGTLSNSSQVFKRNRGIERFSLIDQLTANGVIQPLLKASLFPREPFQEALCPLRAFGLQRRPDFSEVVANFLDLLTIPGLTCTGVSNGATTQIHPNHFRCFTRWVSGQVNRDLDVVVSVATLDQCCTRRILPSQECELIVANRKRQPHTLIEQGNAYVLVNFPIREDSGIQSDRTWFELVHLLCRFQVADDATNCLTSMVRFQSGRCSHLPIGQVMQLRGVANVFTFCNCQYLIASLSKSFQRHVNFLAQLWMDLKLAGYRYGLSHRPILFHPCLLSRQEIVNVGGIEPRKIYAPIPPHLQGDAVSRRSL